MAAVRRQVTVDHKKVHVLANGVRDKPLQARGRVTEVVILIDMVVTDLSMPGMSGFDLPQELLATSPDAPILVTLGYLRPDDQ
jgi:CheY-like chemotaxis protein